MSIAGNQSDTIKTRVLVVDDDPTLLETLADLLEYHCGALVTALPSAEEAMATITPASFDVCVLDYQLDGANGLTLGAMLREINPNARMILLTGELSPTIEALAFEHGFGHVYTKPISLNHLMDAITI